MKRLSFIFSLLALCVAATAQAQLVNNRLNFDFDWKFTLADDASYSDPSTDDSAWRDVQLPHDWNIEQDFVRESGGNAAYLPGGIGWYRKAFTLPKAWDGKHVSVLFDGIFMQSDVYINGQHLGYRPYGFCSIEYDLTPYLKKGAENVLAVRVNTTGDRPRWYAGAGIYRHAWLVVTNPVHITTYGTYVTTPEVTAAKAQVQAVTTVMNATQAAKAVSVSQRIIDAGGNVVATAGARNATVEAGKTADITHSIDLKQPSLWSIDTPTLYTLETIVSADGDKADVRRTTFGVRTIKFDADKGFFLNGQSVKLKGMCLHMDAGCLGTAVPDRSYERRLEILKEYGCNAIRCAHNQPSAEFLDMCDRMGFVVIDEAFDKWKSGYYEKYFDEWWQKDLADMLLRDRNHPSVILWSIGNELQEAWDGGDTGVERARMLQDFVHNMEPSRPVILSAQNGHQDKFSGVTDVVGYNYLEARMLSDHKKHPERCFIVTEELPYYSGEEGNIRSYTPYNPWNIVAANDFIAGGFIWSGVDYWGEVGSQWPAKGWPNGLFDMCMFEKPRAAYHRAMWNAEPMVRIAVPDNSLDIEHGRDLWQWPRMAESWTFPDSYMYVVIEIRTITNCEEVELFFEGKSMGRKATKDFDNNTILWYLPYKHGKLEAVGYNGGKEACRHALVNTGGTTQAALTPDRTTLKADGQDLSHITVELRDKDGNFVQTDDRRVTVTVEGEGRLRGVDNGDVRRDKCAVTNSLDTYFGRALIVVQSTRKAGKIRVNVSVEGVDTPYTVELGTEATATSVDDLAYWPAAGDTLADSRIYGLGGEYLGTDCSKLGGGVYIQNGRKHVIIR